MWTCDQAVIGGEVVQGFQLAFFVSAIPKPDPDERNASGSLFTWQVYSNSRALVQNGNSQYGLNFIEASRADIKETPLVDDRLVFSYSYPPGLDHYKLNASSHGESGRFRQTAAHYYATQTEIRRFFVFQDSQSGTGNDGFVEFGPGSYWAEHSEVPSAETGVNTYSEGYLELRFDEAFSRPFE